MTDLRGQPRAEAFQLGTGDRGCLLIHGFTGTPDEVRPLGEILARRNWVVSGPQLPGHGTVIEDLSRTGWQDWFGTALDAWNDLGHKTRVRTVAGLSMGSLLALHLAAERPQEVQAIVALAPALKLMKQRTAEHARWLARLPFLPRRIAFSPKPDNHRITPAYDHIPIRALASMLELQDLVRSEIHTVSAPCFILTGELDETIHKTAADELKAGLGSTQIRSAHYAASGHILTEDADAEQVLFDIVNFLESVV